MQLWGPRFSAYVVAESDRAVFSLGRLPADERGRRNAAEMADCLEAFLDGRRMPFGEVGHRLGEPPNRLRYAAPTGRVLIRWDGARQPLIWTVPPPDVDPREARLELTRRFIHVFGPTTPAAFATWAAIAPAAGRAAFDAHAESLALVRTPIGDAWILDSDAPGLLATSEPPARARLLPSGDAYYLFQEPDRELLVPDAARRGSLWTSRVWPGAVLVGGELAGTWRRVNAVVTIQPWRPLSPPECEAVEEEASSLPLPGLRGQIEVRWET